jgi:hypothetical protein
MAPTDGYVNPIPNSFRYQKWNMVSLADVSEAAYRGDFDLLEKMLSTGDADSIFNGDLNMHFTDVNPLHMAALAGREDCVKLMLEAGADPHVKTRVSAGQDPKTGQTARDKATKFKHTAVAKLLEQAEKDTPPGWYAPEGIGNNRKLYSAPDPNKVWEPAAAKSEAAKAPEPAKPAAKPAAAATPAAKPSVSFSEPPLPVALLFPGQGSQYVKMLDQVKDLPEVKDMLSKAKAILGYDLLELCLKGPEEKLAETRYCQPAMFVGGLAGVAKLKA